VLQNRIWQLAPTNFGTRVTSSLMATWSFYRAMHHIVQSAVLRSHVVCPSACLSVRLLVCLSMSLVDHNHIGWKFGK